MSVQPAKPMACAHCPWRTSNQGKRHAGHWYTKANLRRLWGGLRRGESMTCHPTDPNNPVPDGMKPVPANARTSECTGALILQQRELMRFQKIANTDPDDALRAYRRAFPRGMTREGLGAIVSRGVFGGTPFGGAAMSKPNLNDADIGHPDLQPWRGREEL